MDGIHTLRLGLVDDLSGRRHLEVWGFVGELNCCFVEGLRQECDGSVRGLETVS